MFIDSHAHVDGPEFDGDRDNVVKRARDAGVDIILNVGTGDPHSGALERAVAFAERNEGVLTALGTHPHDAKGYDDAAEARIKALIKQSARVVAWGEIGLDYHYDHSPREVQREVFRRQLRAARDCGLPVVIHTREAEEDTIGILRSDSRASSRPGVMHCFTGSWELAEAAMEIGYLISFAGVLTFKNAEDLRAVAVLVPLDRLLIETDCPYLSPEPFRGKRNEPARVVEVARCLAKLHDKDPGEIAEITSCNFRRIFDF